MKVELLQATLTAHDFIKTYYHPIRIYKDIYVVYDSIGEELIFYQVLPIRTDGSDFQWTPNFPEKKWKKVLDKFKQLWYNKTIKEGGTSNGEVETGSTGNSRLGD